jgi:hypothetical protein
VTPHDPADLEHEIGRALDALPQPRAPRTLLPRVLAEVQAQGSTRPAHRPWFAWSPLARTMLASVVLAGLTLGYWLWPFAGYAAALLPEPVQQAGRQADAVASMVDALLQVGSLVWQAVVGPIVKGVFTLTLMLCAACALFAAALGRIALGGAHQS